MAANDKRGRDSDDTYEEISLSDIEVDLDEDDDDADDTIVMEDETGSSFEVIPMVIAEVEPEKPTKKARHSADISERVTRVARIIPPKSDESAATIPPRSTTRIINLAEQEYKVHGVPTTFFGRKEELKTLYNAIKQTVNNQQLTIVSITGAAGLGKTRLVNEFFDLIDVSTRNIGALYTWCKERKDTDNFPVFRRLLQARFDIASTDDNKKAYDKLTLALVDVVEQKRLHETVQLLGFLLQLKTSFEASRPDFTSVQLLETRAFKALAGLLKHGAKEQPLILVFDSMQWVQQNTIFQLGQLLTQLKNERILLLYLGRDQFPEPLKHFGVPLTQLSLQPLPANDMQKLCRNILRNVDPDPMEVVGEIASRSLGNPKLAEELVRILVNRGALKAGDKGNWELHADKLDFESLPSTLEGSAELRVNNLPTRERKIIDKSAIFGTTFWFGGLLSLMRLDREESDKKVWSEDRKKMRLNQVMMRLQSDDIIRFNTHTSVKNEIEFSFVQPLEQQHLLMQMKPDVRAKYHRMAAQWLERHQESFMGTIFDVLAHHHESGGNMKKAGYYYFRAAERLQFRYHNDKAIQTYLHALELLQEDDSELICELLNELGRVYLLVGNVDKAEESFQDIIYYSSIISDESWAGKAYLGLGQSLCSKGDYDGAVLLLQKSFSLFQDAHDTVGIANAMDEIGRIHWLKGDYGSYKEALGYYLKSLSLRRKNKDNGAIALSLVNIGNIHLSRGYVKEAEECFLESLEIRKRLGDLRAIAVSLRGTGSVYHEQGRHAKAIEVWEEALKIVEEIGDRGMYAALLNKLGEGYVQVRNLGQAVAYLNEAVELAEEITDKRTLADIFRNLAAVFLVMDDPIKARESCERSLAVAEEIQSNLAIGQGLATLAEIFALTLYSSDGEGEMDKRASECFQKSMNFLEEMGDELEYAKVLKSYGTFLIERGVSNKGRKLLKKSEGILSRVTPTE